MERFKLNEKEYFVQVAGNEYTINEFGNKNFQYVFTKSELEDLDITYGAFPAFTSRGIEPNIVEEISLCATSDNHIGLKIVAKDSAYDWLASISLALFCKDILQLYLDESQEEHSLTAQSPSIAFALKQWNQQNNLLLMQDKFILLNSNRESVGVGYFVGQQAYVISRCDLSLFETLALYMPNKNSVHVTLIPDKSVSPCPHAAVYSIRFTGEIQTVQQSSTSYASLIQYFNLLGNFDLSNEKEHEIICNAFHLKEITKAKSTLDDFLSL